jgi:hypothetical protein
MHMLIELQNKCQVQLGKQLRRKARVKHNAPHDKLYDLLIGIKSNYGHRRDQIGL